MNKRKWLLFLVIAGLAVLLWWLNKQHLQLAPKDVKNWVLQFGLLAPFVFLFLSLFRPFVLVPLTVFHWQRVWPSEVFLGRFMPSSVQPLAHYAPSCLLQPSFQKEGNRIKQPEAKSGDIPHSGAWVSLHFVIAYCPHPF